MVIKVFIDQLIEFQCYLTAREICQSSLLTAAMRETSFARVSDLTILRAAEKLRLRRRRWI